MECAECDNLLCRREALDVSATRVKSALKTAHQACDAEALPKLTREVQRLTECLVEVREALSRHQTAAHSDRQRTRSAGAGGRFVF